MIYIFRYSFTVISRLIPQLDCCGICSVVLLGVLGRHFFRVVIAGFLTHVPGIPRDMFRVHFLPVGMLRTLADYLRGWFVLPDLLPNEVADFLCGFLHVTFLAIIHRVTPVMDRQPTKFNSNLEWILYHIEIDLCNKFCRYASVTHMTCWMNKFVQFIGGENSRAHGAVLLSCPKKRLIWWDLNGGTPGIVLTDSYHMCLTRN